jgi:SpoVK/Ycf46/Vps4 family AAA+-type ATPase
MIVVCEEFDRLSTQALTILKDGFLEKWMPKVAFIATTNNIQKIDSALLQRFNIKMNF